MGPLSGVKILEIAGIGPGPFCAMMLADQGAEVMRIDRAAGVRGGDPATPPMDTLARGRRSIGLDLKNPEGVETLLRLVESADGLIEGFRPGVMERLGVGPDVCLARNEKLVFGRMTGWGQEGPMAQAAGHDINYIALSGALGSMGREGEAPPVPLNLIGDFGGGGMLLAYGMLCGLLEAKNSGKGQVVDAAMVDGASIMMGFFHSMKAIGVWSEERGSNLLDGGAHFYDSYETSDGKWISVGSIEPQFYALLLEKTGLAGEELPAQMSRDEWPGFKAKLAAIFKSKTRAQWCEIMEGSDVCFSPVLSMSEAVEHPHAVARNAFLDIGGYPQPAPAPRFSRTPAAVPTNPPHAGQHTDEVLGDWGFSASEIAGLRDSKAVA